MHRRSLLHQLADDIGLAGDGVGPPAWYARARCVDADPAAFFPEKGETPQAALRICGGCKVVDLCLKHALDHDLDDGVWGGMPARQRAGLARQQSAA